jgi:hypothetical protein
LHETISVVNASRSIHISFAMLRLFTINLLLNLISPLRISAPFPYLKTIVMIVKVGCSDLGGGYEMF